MPYRVTLHGPERAALINLRARAQARAAIESELGFALPAPSGPATGSGGTLAFALGPDEWLLRTPLPDEDEWLRRLEAALAGRPASAVLVSDAYGVLRIEGPDSLPVLAQATGVDRFLTVLSATPEGEEWAVGTRASECLSYFGREAEGCVFVGAEDRDLEAARGMGLVGLQAGWSPRTEGGGGGV